MMKFFCQRIRMKLHPVRFTGVGFRMNKNLGGRDAAIVTDR